nr:MAG TPA: hypothetical protein [Caudoviricetes sp.]
MLCFKIIATCLCSWDIVFHIMGLISTVKNNEGKIFSFTNFFLILCILGYTLSLACIWMR